VDSRLAPAGRNAGHPSRWRRFTLGIAERKTMNIDSPQVAKSRALGPEFKRSIQYLGDEASHPLEARRARAALEAYIRGVVTAYIAYSDERADPKFIDAAFQEAGSALFIYCSSAGRGFQEACRKIRGELIAELTENNHPVFGSTVLEAVRAPAEDIPLTAKVTRLRSTPHENPESLLKGKSQITKNTAGVILGLSERGIRCLIEEGSLSLIGEGHRKMVTVASLRTQIKSPTKSA
jgi:hypothetical protein